MVLTLDQAKGKRTSIKASATRYKKQLEVLNANTVSVAELETRKEKFEQLWDQYDQAQTQVESFVLEAVDTPEERDRVLNECEGERNKFENFYHSTLAQIIGGIDRLKSRSMANSPSIPTENAPKSIAENKIKLRAMDVPTFAGSFDTWRSFRDSFRSLVHDNESLTKIQKFHHLQASLKGPAADVLDSIELCDENYDEAWALLNKRFNYEKWIIEGHVNALLNLPAIKRDTPEALRQLHDSTLKNLRALNSLNRPTKHWGDMMVQLILSRLDSHTFQRWELTRTSDEFPSLDELLSFLLKQAISLETVRKQFGPSKPDQSHKVLITKHAKTHLAAVKPVCPKCKGPHLAFECSSFRELPPNERLRVIQSARLCTNCLRTNKHNARNCSGGRCRKCEKAHHTLLHLERSSSDRVISIGNDMQSSANPSTIVGCLVHPSTVLLSTALVQVQRSNGTWASCVALLDSGSQPNFITNTLASELRIALKPTNIAVKGISQDTVAARKCAVVRFRSRLSTFEQSLDCLVVGPFTDPTPQSPLPRSGLSIPKNIKLANPDFCAPCNIDMLIGADTYYKLLCVGQIRPPGSELIYQKTHLGWLVAGRPYASNHSEGTQSPLCHLCSIEQLGEGLARFWEVDSALNIPNMSSEGNECEEWFSNTTHRNSSGRFIVRLPFKEDILQQLGSSQSIAERRFLSIERKLQRDTNLKREYIEFMREYEKLGHMSQVESPELDSRPSYYIPHHAVIKPTSTTTRVRVVFDASCKTDTKVSLNDALKVGPVLQDDLFSILLRFRSFRVAMTADVTKMYRQVLVDCRDTPFQRILWRENPNSPLKTFELKTVTYGTAPASYLAIKTLRHLAHIESSQYPLGSKIILRDFYVDDLLTGADTIQEATHLRQQTMSILEKGGFELRKWASNHLEVLPDQTRIQEIHSIYDPSHEVRTLGMIWLSRADQFAFAFASNPNENLRVTKRAILARIASIFDPLGLLGPVVLLAKLILQKLWQERVNWDESLPADLHTQWVGFERELPLLADLNIPRRLSSLNDITKFELHSFCDASEIAYGACIYLVTQDSFGNRMSSLACAKSRVAPLKSLSIPRLELCGALLSYRLTAKVIAALPIKLNSISYYTDSMVVLHWLASASRNLATFVANRVGEIQQNSKLNQWHHVSTNSNPADSLSRGLCPHDLAQLELWWYGPSWLCDGRNSIRPFLPDVNFDVPERRTCSALARTTVSMFDQLCYRFSSVTRLIRVVAYVLRFINKLRKNHKELLPKWLTTAELKEALTFIVRDIQSVAFCKEIQEMKNDLKAFSSNALRFLNPFVDESGVLRVGGRLKNSCLSYSAKHPILLPAKHPFTTLIIEYEHKRNLHIGPQVTLAIIRQKFWPLSARNMIRKSLRKCVVCFKAHPSRSQPMMGDLPDKRVQCPPRPFFTIGIDFCGPFTMIEGFRRSTRQFKVYVSVFVCFATKAIHLELVLDLTTEAFLNAFKRFIARRGRPADVYSDNGLNFVGADRELQRLFETESDNTDSTIVKFANNEAINWHFSPPRAPHFGGLWEAAVKSFKYLFKRTAGNVTYRQDELNTLLANIEAVLNSRPISACSNDPGDVSYLSPGHFLIGTAMNAYPEPNLVEVPMNRLNRWQKVEQCRQHFWKRWQREYLNQIQQRYKWHKPSESPYVIGRLVIVAEDNLPPLSWTLGRIADTFPGADGIVRTVSVRIGNRCYKRPVTKLYPLPVD